VFTMPVTTASCSRESMIGNFGNYLTVHVLGLF